MQDHPPENDTASPVTADVDEESVSALAVVDDAGTVLAWTDGARRLAGFRTGEIVGRPAAQLVAPGPVGRGGEGRARARRAPSAARTVAACRRLMRRGRPWTHRMDVACRDGRTVPVLLRALPLDGAGASRRWLLSATAPGRQSPLREPPVPGAALDRSPVGVGLWGLDLRSLWLNAAAAEHFGGGPTGPGGAPAADVALEEGEVAKVLRRVVEQGTPVVDHHVRRSAGPGAERTYALSAYRLDASGGAPMGVCTVSFDVSGSGTRQALSLLNRASRSIGTTLNVMATAQELADAVVPVLADYATVELTESVGPGYVPAERPGSAAFGEPAFVRGGLASVTAGAPEAVFSPGERVFLPRSSPIARPVSTGRSRLEADLDTGAPWLDEDPARARAVRRAGMHSAMFLPLRARGALLGVAVLVRTVNPAPFTPDDLLLAEEFVARAALSIDNASRYSRERGAALALQRALLPGRLRGGRGLEIAYRYLPTGRHDAVGGDWCDVIPLPRGRTALVVGDVMGHGIQAAASMGQMRTAVHTLAALDMPPSRLLARLDTTAAGLSGEDWTSPDHGGLCSYATCVYAVHDPATGRCSMARAGHPPPLLLTPEGHARPLDVPAGAPLGAGRPAHSSIEADVLEGSVLALYTDGLVESRTHDIDRGLDRLARALERRTGLGLEEMCSGVVADLAGPYPADDIALLLARAHADGS